MLFPSPVESGVDGSSNKALTTSLTKTMNEFKTTQSGELKKVTGALALSEKCSSEGKLVSAGKCVLNTEKNTKLKCDTNVRSHFQDTTGPCMLLPAHHAHAHALKKPPPCEQR